MEESKQNETFYCQSWFKCCTEKNLAWWPIFLTEIWDFCYKYVLSGKGSLFSTFFVWIRLGRQHRGIGHILCMGHTVKYSMSYFNLKRLLNQAMTTYMKYMLPIRLLAVTFWSEEISKFSVEMCFCEHRRTRATL